MICMCFFSSGSQHKMNYTHDFSLSVIYIDIYISWTVTSSLLNI